MEEPQAKSAYRRMGEAFAAERGIDLSVQLQGHVKDAKAADADLKALKEAIPEVPSAFRPSGRVPFTALLWMIVGVILGIPLGILAGGVFAAIGFYWVQADPRKLHGKARLIPILGYLCLFLTIPVAGAVSTMCTAACGSRGKNRNVIAGLLFALLSSSLTMLIAWTLFEIYGKEVLNQAAGFNPGEMDLHYKFFAILGGVLGGFAACFLGWDIVQSNKYCEDCECYMKENQLPCLCLGGMTALASALAEKNLKAAVGLLEAAPGSEGQPKLFSCPQCDKGYLELTAAYAVGWAEKQSLLGGEEPRSKETSWLVASLELSPEEVGLFKPLIVKDDSGM